MNFSVDLTGQVALVTGAGDGIGRAIALALAKAGAAVGVNDINPNRTDQVADEIVALGGQALPWSADISNKYQVSAMIEALRDRFKNMNILVNAAGVQKEESFLKLDEYDWRRTLEVNLTGTFFCSQLCGRVMADEGGGTILTLASSYGHPLTLDRQAVYVTSKAGIVGLTKSMARELAPARVRVNALCPADIQEPNQPQVIPSNPQGRVGLPEEVAATALFLCSDAASFITGQVIHIDGGLAML